MSSIHAIGGIVMFAAAVGCAHATPPPQDLVTARAAYDRANRGPTAQINPAALHTAKDALDAAEHSFKANGDTQETRDLAYTADRWILAAEAEARTMQLTQQKDQVTAEMNASTLNALGRANQQLAAQQQQLKNEAERRQEAERRAAQASADLARIASVRVEPRGMIITLSGSILFTTGQAELLPSAQAKLSQVANELVKQDSESKIVVEGHTDSQGSASFNHDLSQRRAESVRDYLVAHGVAADRVTAQGFGSTRPVGDNASPEGRANNRRVEIVVSPPK